MAAGVPLSRAFIIVDVDDEEGRRKVADFNARLRDLSSRAVNARVGIEGDKAANLALDRLLLRLDRLDRKTAKPEVSLLGFRKMMIELGAIDLAVDKINKKSVGIGPIGRGLGSLLASLTKAGKGGGLLGGAGGGLGKILSVGAGEGGGILGSGVSGFGAAGGVGAIVAAIAAIAVAANAAAGAVTFGLGGAIAGLGIIAARHLPGVSKAFADLKNNASLLLHQISGVFGATLVSLAQRARTVLPGIMAALGSAFRAIAPAIFNLGSHLIAALGGPQVQQAIRDIGTAFAGLANALAPDLPSIINGIASGFDAIARSVNPQTFAILINFFGHLAGWALQAFAAISRLGGAIASIIRPVANALNSAINAWIKFTHAGGNAASVVGHAAAQAVGQVIPFFGAIGHGNTSMGKFASTAKAASAGVNLFGGSAGTAAPKLATLAGNMATLARNTQNYVNTILTGLGDQLAWQQALHAEKAQLDSNSAGLKGNSANALANKQATLDATNAVIAFAEQQRVTHGNLQTVSQALQAQIRYLQQHGDKSKFAAAEIKALRKEESLIRAQIKSNILVSGSGTFKVFQVTGAGAGGGAVAHGTHLVPGGAAGMFVRGGVPGMDSVLINAMPGELVVPTSMVKAGAVDHLRGQIPGFAAGGVVSSYSGPPSKAMGKWAVNEWKATIHAIQSATATATASAISAAQAAAAAASRFISGPSRFGGSSAAEAFARSLLPSYGWANQWPALFSLWQRESGWNPWAVNPSSGAAGIPQALGHGHVFNLGDYANQIRWGLAYIRGKYGSPDAAWAHELAFGWYDRGGYLPPGLSMAYNGTGKPEPVGAAATGDLKARLDRTNSLLATLVKQGTTAPAETAAGLGKVFNQTARMGARASYYSTRPAI